MKGCKKMLAYVLAAVLIFSVMVPWQLSAEGLTRTVSKEVIIYEWDLTSPGTFWSVTDGTSNPLKEYMGGAENCEFRIDANGAYISGKNYWPAFTTTGVANNVDLTDPTTKLIIEIKTSGKAHFFAKASFDENLPDTKGTLFEKELDGYFRFEKNISSDSSRFAALELGVWAGSSVTFKSAKIVKTVTGPRTDENDAVKSKIYDFSLTDPVSDEFSDISVSQYANPVFSDSGVTVSADYQWVGVTTSPRMLDISDPSTRLVVEIDNPENATVALKCSSESLYSEDTALEKELILTSENGFIEITLDSAFTAEQLEAMSFGNVSFSILVGSTGVPVLIKSLKLIKNTVNLNDVRVDLGKPENYWQMQGFPTSEEYILSGETRPYEGICETGSYKINSDDNSLQISANEANGIFWYIVSLNSVRVDLRRNPILKINVPDTAERWNIKFNCNGSDFGIFDEYNNPNIGEITVELSDYMQLLSPPETSASEIVNLGISFVVLTNGQNNKPTVFKDLEIVYPDSQNYEQVISVETIKITTDTENTAVLPEKITVYTEHSEAEISVNWKAPDGYTDESPGTYLFTGTLSFIELEKHFLKCDIPVTAEVSVTLRYPEGDLNRDTKSDIKDLIHIKKYFSGFVEIADQEIFDLNGDGFRDAKDIVYLKKILLKIPERTYRINEDETLYKTQGRTSVGENGLSFTHTGVSFEINAYCEGNVVIGMSASDISNEKGSGIYFTVYVDGIRSEERFEILNNGNKNITVAQNLEAGNHTVALYRQSEYDAGDACVTFVRLNGYLTNPPQDKEYYLEFIGDSLTAGFGNLNENYDSSISGGAPLYQDGTQTYAFLAAQAINADISVVAVSGIGIISGYQPYLMPDVYEEFPWNNYRNEREPDAIIINLGTNDYTTKDLNGITLEEIQDGMESFMLKLRALHPESKIIFASGIMIDELCHYAESAVRNVGGKNSGFYYLQLEKNTDGLSGHCDLQGHITNAEILIDFLNSTLDK